jgi:hypothetical protein
MGNTGEGQGVLSWILSERVGACPELQQGQGDCGAKRDGLVTLLNEPVACQRVLGVWPWEAFSPAVDKAIAFRSRVKSGLAVALWSRTYPLSTVSATGRPGLRLGTH